MSGNSSQVWPSVLSGLVLGEVMFDRLLKCACSFEDCCDSYVRTC